VSTFAGHLEETFKPNEVTKRRPQNRNQQSAVQITQPIKFLTPKEIQNIIHDINRRKAPGYDLITGRITKKKKCQEKALTSKNYMQRNY
jgi:hypothetical protein